MRILNSSAAVSRESVFDMPLMINIYYLLSYRYEMIGFGKVNTGVDMRVRRPVYRQILIVRCENSELFIFVQ